MMNTVVTSGDDHKLSHNKEKNNPVRNEVK